MLKRLTHAPGNMVNEAIIMGKKKKMKEYQYYISCGEKAKIWFVLKVQSKAGEGNTGVFTQHRRVWNHVTLSSLIIRIQTSVKRIIISAEEKMGLGGLPVKRTVQQLLCVWVLVCHLPVNISCSASKSNWNFISKQTLVISSIVLSQKQWTWLLSKMVFQVQETMWIIHIIQAR